MRTFAVALLTLGFGAGAAWAQPVDVSHEISATCEAASQTGIDADQIRQMVQTALERASAAVEASRLDAETKAEVQAAIAAAVQEVEIELADLDVELASLDGAQLSAADWAEIEAQVEEALNLALSELDTALAELETEPR